MSIVLALALAMTGTGPSPHKDFISDPDNLRFCAAASELFAEQMADRPHAATAVANHRRYAEFFRTGLPAGDATVAAMKRDLTLDAVYSDRYAPCATIGSNIDDATDLAGAARLADIFAAGDDEAAAGAPDGE